MATSKQNFGLNQQQFEELLSNLKKGDMELFKQIFISHFNSCKQYIQSKYKASDEDAHDVTMDTILEFRRRLLADKVQYGNLRFLFTQMASQRYLRLLKNNRKEILDQDFEEVIEEQPYSEQELAILESAWSMLSESCKKLLRWNVYDGIKLNEIAKMLDKQASAVRKQKERCMNKLIEIYKQQTDGI